MRLSYSARALVHRRCVATVTVLLLTICVSEATAGVVFGLTGGITGGFRWDAAPRTINGRERSLAGGLRYSMEGGSYAAFRDQFQWVGAAPSDVAFQTAVENAFNAWTVADPVTGLSTALTFTADFGTAVVGTATGGGINTAGAEIDLFASPDANSWNPGDPGTRAEAFFNAVTNTAVTLTSGVTGYLAGAISGADITINNNPLARYTLPLFQTLLTHEIGHTLGLGDVDFNPGVFIDDNYDGSSPASALATLTNSWAHLVNVFNPAASPLSLFNVANGNPGVDTPGVDILMESNLASALIGDPQPLRNDDFGMRQFLYPILPSAVPEASSLALFTVAALGWGGLRRRARGPERGKA